MGIRVEFDPELALRNIAEFNNGNRKKDECLPEELKAGETYSFLKREQRLYWIHGEIPVVETKGGEALSRPKASIVILEVTHFLDNGEVWTRGKYKVVEVFSDDKIYFEGLDRINSRKE